MESQCLQNAKRHENQVARTVVYSIQIVTGAEVISANWFSRSSEMLPEVEDQSLYRQLGTSEFCIPSRALVYFSKGHVT